MKGQIKNLHIKQYCPPKSGENLRLTLTWSSNKCLYAVYEITRIVGKLSNIGMVKYRKAVYCFFITVCFS